MLKSISPMDTVVDTHSSDTEPVPHRCYGADGVDVSLIRWMLALSPSQRLQVLQDTVRSLMELKRRAGVD